MDSSDFLERLLAVFEDAGVEFCIIGGTAVNAYSPPVVTLDLDVAIAIRDLPRIEKALAEQFTVQRFAHRFNVAARDSDLRLQIQTDPRYEAFVARARVRDVLGLRLPVAAAEDVLQGKIWAVQDQRMSSRSSMPLEDRHECLSSTELALVVGDADREGLPRQRGGAVDRDRAAAPFMAETQ